MSHDGNRFQVLCHQQVCRLHKVMEEKVAVHGKGNFPTLNILLTQLVRQVKAKLSENGVKVKDIRLNGGAASYALGCEHPVQPYNDLDLIFGIDLDSPSDFYVFHKVLDSVMKSLMEFLPSEVNKEKMTSVSMKEAYVHKMVKVTNDSNCWSLISLSNLKGRNVELKFVHKMRRQFEFSVDSFQILLDSLLTFYDVSQDPMTEHFYPTIVAESMYGNFAEAMFHLNNRLIATRNPEQIRGGGLLKYCNLLVRGYEAAEDSNIKGLERYMCSRFFIDFPDIAQQQLKLENYLRNHFNGEIHLQYDYLMILYRVVDDSTICLMNHERRLTLNLINSLGNHLLLEEEQKAYNKQLAIHQFDNQSKFHGLVDQQSNFIIDQVYYGTCSPVSNTYGQVAEQYYGYPAYVNGAYVSSAPCTYCAPSSNYLSCS